MEDDQRKTIDAMSKAIGNMQVINPCPFCGNRAEYCSYNSCDCCNKDYNAGIKCTKCSAIVDHLDTDAEALRAWNKRDNHESTLLEALEAFMDKIDDTGSGKCCGCGFEDEHEMGKSAIAKVRGVSNDKVD